MSDIIIRGPFFSAGMRMAAIDEALDDAKRDVAAQVWADVAQNLNRSIRQPTPYYETQIEMEARGADYVVHDRGVIYGPWLEGTGSRNRSTRFKGYRSFRRAFQSVAGKVTALAAPHFARAARKLGGS